MKRRVGELVLTMKSTAVPANGNTKLIKRRGYTLYIHVLTYTGYMSTVI